MIHIWSMGYEIGMQQAVSILSSKDWGGVTKDSIINRCVFFVCEDDIPKAICVYSLPGFFYEDCVGLDIMAVHEKYRGKGFVKYIAQELFKIATELQKGVRLSQYTSSGEKRAKSVFRRYAETFHRNTGLEYIEGYEYIYNRKQAIEHV